MPKTARSEPLSAPRAGRSPLLWLTLFPVLAALLLFDVLFGGQVLLPAVFQNAFYPWTQELSDAARQALPQWNPLQWDGMAEFYPWRLHAVKSFQSGYIPLWNPSALCGTPFLANSQSAPFYPLHALLYLPGDPGTAVRMGWLAALHLTLAGSFTFLLARHVGMGAAAAALAGSVYELSGFLVQWLELPSFPAVSCWIPLVVLLVRLSVRKADFGLAAAAGLAGGVMLLAGHLQVAFYGLMAVGLFWLAEALPAARQGRLLRAIGCGALFGLIALCLAAPQMLPSIELSRISHRVGAPTEEGYKAYTQLALPAANWLSLLIPDVYGSPLRGDYWALWRYGAPNVLEFAGYCGLPATALALLAALRKVARREAMLWFGLGLFAFLLASGTPLCRLFYFGVPGFAQSGSPARALVLVCFAAALLAGFGAEEIQERVERDWKSAALSLAGACGLIAALVGILWVLAPGLAAREYTKQVDLTPVLSAVSAPALGRGLLMLAASVGLVTILAWLLRDNPPEQRRATIGGALLFTAAGTLLFSGLGANPTAPDGFAYRGTELTRWLAAQPDRVSTLNRGWRLDQTSSALMPPNTSTAMGWRDTQGYDSLLLGAHRRLADAADATGNASPQANGNMVFTRAPLSSLHALMAAPILVSRVALDPLPPIQPFTAGPVYVYRNPAALPEARVISYWEDCSDADAILKLKQWSADDLINSALIHDGRASDLGAPAAGGPPGATRPVTIHRDRGPNRIRLRLDAGPAGLLLLAESAAPGWRAYTAGTSQPFRPARANIAFQVAPVGPNAAEMEWRYEPSSFRAGLWLALTAMSALTALAAARIGVRRTGPGSGRPDPA